MRKRFIIAIVASLALASVSGAVLIDSGDGTGNTRAPTPDPGWANVGTGNGLTAIYLGEGWVLSAAHVGEVRVRIDGTVYPPLTGSRVVLRHPGGSESDLEIFRLAPYPAHLPSIALRATPVRVGEPTLMVGHGRNRGPALQTSQPGGYGWGPHKRMRWGTNVVSATGVEAVALGKTTRSFTTTFDRAGSRDECQATPGDSGGPVFTREGARWQLAGIIWAKHEPKGQTPETTRYGNLTIAADLSYYRDQIQSIMTPACGNGHVTLDEACDDGNKLDGDCCSAACRFEASGSACDDGSRCTEADRCDGAGVCQPGATNPCDDGDSCTEDRCSEQSGCENVFVSGPACVPPPTPDAR